MDKNLDRLLISLDDEIERKCFELKQKRLQKAMKNFFLLACVMLLLFPFIMVFAGINLVTLLMPVVIFIGIALFALLPLVLDNGIGGITE